jgi:hypothetical protein
MHSTTTINQLRLTTTSSATGFLFWSEVTLRDTDCLTARRRLRCAWRSSGARSGSCRTGWLRRTRTPNSPGKVRRSGRSDRGPHRHCESDAAAPSWQGSRRRSPRSAVEWSRNAARIAPHRGQRRQCAASYCRQVGVETHPQRGTDANQRQGTYPSAFVGQLLFLAHRWTCFYQFLDNNLY